jgi:hypothetical protein
MKIKFTINCINIKEWGTKTRCANQWKGPIFLMLVYDSPLVNM